MPDPFFSFFSASDQHITNINSEATLQTLQYGNIYLPDIDESLLLTCLTFIIDSMQEMKQLTDQSKNNVVTD